MEGPSIPLRNACPGRALVVSDCQVIGNVAQGGAQGSSAVGGDSLGGGLYAGSGAVVLEAVLVSGN